MKIIDAHTHTLPFKEAVNFAKTNGIDYSEKGLNNELKKNSVERIVSLTTINSSTSTPVGLEQIKKQIERNKKIVGVCSINPKKITFNSLKISRDAILNQEIKGFKIHPGHAYVSILNKKYFPFYKLAGKYGCPVIIHTGDLFEKGALLKFSHPLNVDELAVMFPDTTFIMAHLGNPWIIDASEVLYKNDNVYADLSGLLIGKNVAAHPLVKYVKNSIEYTLEYVENPNKFLYGSDWPFVKMFDYISLIKKIIPQKYHQRVFYSNSKKLFNL